MIKIYNVQIRIISLSLKLRPVKKKRKKERKKERKIHFYDAAGVFSFQFHRKTSPVNDNEADSYVEKSSVDVSFEIDPLRSLSPSPPLSS